MAAINDLINQIEDKELRTRIEQELNKLTKQKKFGIVFEEHLPECVPLYDMPIKRGCKVALKTGKVNEFYTVMQVEGDNVYCTDKKENQLINFLKKDLVCVSEFGEPIYPYLKQIDSIYNSDDTELPTHALIQADNYHALQLLEYLYAGKVDCIYIDPPYNTGARDWKYNNDYVDSSDTYRHSKWLSMMKKRLLLAKKLLNPTDSVLIVTIDEKEYLHLGCLLEELFPEANMQMVSSVINRAGTGRKYEFSRTDEYLFFVRFGAATIALDKVEGENTPVVWDTLRRSGPTNTWSKTKRQFYPIFVEDKTKVIHSVGNPLIYGIDRMEDVVVPKGCTAVYPIRDNGLEMMWGCVREELLSRLERGYIRVGKHTPDKPQKYVISYLTGGIIADIASGKAFVENICEDGSVNAFYYGGKEIPPTTNWSKPTHDAQWYGSNLLKSILTSNRFSYPKSLYAVRDCLYYATNSKPNALIVDFFAGSGTTLHAVNLLNAEDGGKRQCIMVTNNEVSNDEAKLLIGQGLSQSDKEWEKFGIANYVTWPRTVCSIDGKNIKGEPLKGNYIGNDIPMADGFKANAVFFKLGFLDKTSVQLGRQFKELIPLLWLKAGGWGKCPYIEKNIKDNILPPYIILPENRFAVLIDENFFVEFEPKVNEQNDIRTAFIVTDFEKGFKSMSNELKVEKTYQLYRDYLDNFRINTERN